MRLVSTPYDDVFRTLLNDCSSLIIPLINEVFGERYTGKEKIVFSPNVCHEPPGRRWRRTDIRYEF